MKTSWRIIALLTSLGYLYPALWMERSDAYGMFLFFILEFACYFLLVRWTPLSIREILYWSILPRSLFVLASVMALTGSIEPTQADPHLSDDYHRFYWDGKLVASGQDVYAQTPRELQASELRSLNSPDYYSVYPPVHQLFFAAASFGTSKTEYVFVTRILLLLIDLLVMVLLFRLSNVNGRRSVLLYAFNPMIIVELTGNLHFEGVCVAFLLLGVHSLQQKKDLASLGYWLLSISTKIVPLLLFPLWLWYRPFGRSFLLGTVLVLAFVLSFFILTDVSGITHFFESVDLYYRKFEFNASVYFMLRWLGTAALGYNPIHIIGPTLALCFLLFLFWMIFRGKNVFRDPFAWMLLIITVYYFLATTIHPWYITYALVLGILSGMKFPILWSGMVILSYGLYTYPQFSTGILCAEYLTLFAYIGYEWRQKRSVLFLSGTRT